MVLEEELRTVEYDQNAISCKKNDLVDTNINKISFTIDVSDDLWEPARVSSTSISGVRDKLERFFSYSDVSFVNEFLILDS